MNESEFIHTQSEHWNRLSFLCERGVSKKSLSGAELDELLVLYLRVSKDLAVARTQDANPSIIIKLNDLVQKAYSLLYRRPKLSFFGAIGSALRTSARSVRRQARFVWLSAGLFLFFSIVTGIFSARNPGIENLLLPPGMRANADGWVHGLPGRTSSESSLMTGFYASNNPQASLITGALGACTFGFGSLFTLYANGANMGVLGMLMARANKLHVLLLTIFPHGVPELSGFMISSGAGMALGWAVLAPGRKTRLQSIADVGRDAVPMLATSIVLMWIAAPIEGWFSYDPRVPLAVKGLFGLGEVIAWGFFWTFCGRESAGVVASPSQVSS